MPKNDPQQNWGDSKQILSAYSHYHSTIPISHLNGRFFEKLGKLRKQLYRQHKRFGSWDKVSQEYPWRPIPPGTLSTFAKDGYLPVKWFGHFGLPTFKPAQTCPSCGEVHTTSRCTKKKRAYKDLFSIPPEILKWQLENRK